MPPGRVPRHKDVILLADLIDRARPGGRSVHGVHVVYVGMYVRVRGANSYYFSLRPTNECPWRKEHELRAASKHDFMAHPIPQNIASHSSFTSCFGYGNLLGYLKTVS